MFKQLVHSILRVFNIKLSRIPSYDVPDLPFDLFEHVLVKVLHETGPSFRFIQVGANDLIMDDKFSSLIRKYKISGCLVEDIPDCFEQFKLYYSDQPQITLYNIKVGTNISTVNNKRHKTKKIMATDVFHKIIRRILYRNLNHDTLINQSKKNENFKILIHNLNKICEDLNYVNLHLLYIKSKFDINEIIYQALDAQLYPVIINYDWTEMSSAENYRLKMRLLDEGYRFIDVGEETVCVRQYS